MLGRLHRILKPRFAVLQSMSEKALSIPKGELAESHESGPPKKRSRKEIRPYGGVKGDPIRHKFPLRVRAHCNPLADVSFYFPSTPAEVQWRDMYPAIEKYGGERNATVDTVDVGCAWGGMTIALSKQFPESNVLGFEIRGPVAEYTQQRIETLRKESESTELTHPGENVWALRCNAMKHFTHYFAHQQLQRLYFLYADPHFKKANHRRRIVSRTLLDDYAYCLRPGGRIYIATDVQDLFQWMYSHLSAHSLFSLVTDPENDKCYDMLISESEDAQRCIREGIPCYRAIFERKPHQIPSGGEIPF